MTMKWMHTLGWMSMGLSLAAGQEAPRIDYKPLKFGGSQEFGQISSFTVVTESPRPRRDEWVDHFGAYFLQEATVNERLDLSVGLGGVFQFPKPEKNRADFFGSQYKMFYVGPAVAEAVYKFGDPEAPSYTLGGGMFGYKYNTEAVNLGEYLFRSTPYPSTVSTGGLNTVNDNAAHMQGFKAGATWGRFHVDALIQTETQIPPLYDWSPAVVATYTSESGLFSAGAGANFKHLIKVRPSRTDRKVLGNSYFTSNDTVYTGNLAYYDERKNFYNALAASYTDPADSLEFQRATENSATWNSRGVFMQSHVDTGTGLVSGADYYSPAGTILMARATLALNKLLRLPGNEEDLKIYFETALLGLKDYPLFYTKKSERMPVMVGVNLPTFGMLDLLAVQAEYLKSSQLNSYYYLAEGNVAIPYMPEGDLNAYSKTDYLDATESDNFSWSILARKSIYNTFTISAQLARDHLRTVNADWWYASKQEPNEVLPTSKAWYWMLQFGWNI
jgi:hypothetical protein